ncbi:uncharacterized protein [Bos taurus]|nr:uncharacterized LOC128092246 homolog [Bos taurus]
MYLEDSRVLLNTLCRCCHRKIWLHSGEVGCGGRTDASRP